MKLGNKIKMLRGLKRMTQDQLAKQTGLTKSSISQIEKNKISPSITSMIKICHALGTTASRLFEGMEVEIDEKIVLKKNERKRIFPETQKGRLYRLTTDNMGKVMEPLQVILKPGMKTEKSRYSYKGQTFGFILKGKAKLFLGKKTYLLNKGDSTYYDTFIPHRWENVGKKDAVLILVISPPMV